ncbi:hypothetical protein ScPMuIL_008418 [Solemya velum]
MFVVVFCSLSAAYGLNCYACTNQDSGCGGSFTNATSLSSKYIRYNCKSCGKADALGAIERKCSSESHSTGCVTIAGKGWCYCNENLCNSVQGSTVKPVSILLSIFSCILSIFYFM